MELENKVGDSFVDVDAICFSIRPAGAGACSRL